MIAVWKCDGLVEKGRRFARRVSVVANGGSAMLERAVQDKGEQKKYGETGRVASELDEVEIRTGCGGGGRGG